MPSKSEASQRIPWVETGDSALTHVCYKDEGEQLWLAYGSGNVYRFVGIPKRWYTELMKASKPARYVRDHLQNRFDMRRLKGFDSPSARMD